MDLRQTLRHKVLVERKNFPFFVELDYENLPAFCSHCTMVDQDTESCFKLHMKTNVNQPHKRILEKDKPKTFVPVRDGRHAKDHMDYGFQDPNALKSVNLVHGHVQSQDIDNTFLQVPVVDTELQEVVVLQNHSDGGVCQ